MKTAHVPPLSTDPAYAAAHHTELRLAAELRRRKDELAELLANRPQDATNLTVEELSEVSTRNSRSLWTESVIRTRELIATLEMRLKTARRETHVAGTAAATKIAEGLRPAYSELQGRLAPKVAELAALADEEADFRRAMTEAGVPPELLRINALNQFRLTTRDGGSIARRFLDEAARHHGVKVNGR